jgi:hypothetical protein
VTGDRCRLAAGRPLGGRGMAGAGPRVGLSRAAWRPRSGRRMAAEWPRNGRSLAPFRLLAFPWCNIILLFLLSVYGRRRNATVYVVFIRGVRGVIVMSVPFQESYNFQIAISRRFVKGRSGTEPRRVECRVGDADMRKIPGGPGARRASVLGPTRWSVWFSDRRRSRRFSTRLEGFT